MYNSHKILLSLLAYVFFHLTDITASDFKVKQFLCVYPVLWVQDISYGAIGVIYEAYPESVQTSHMEKILCQ